MTMSSNRIMVVSRPLAVAVAAGALVSDSFDRANSATSLGTADTGQVWSHASGEWGITTNQAYKPSGSLPASIESGASDARVLVDITHDGDNGVAFRYLDDNHFLMARLGANAVELYRREGGVWNLVSSVAMTLTAGQVYALKVVFSGSTIDVFVDGVSKITATSAFQSTATKHGLFGSTAGSRWDNFKVEAA